MWARLTVNLAAVEAAHVGKTSSQKGIKKAGSDMEAGRRVIHYAMDGEEKRTGAADLLVLTVGHSTRELEEFFGLLRAHVVERIVDVRTVPKSRRNPQFNRDSLCVTAPEAGFEYVHVPQLGGLRRARKDSVNLGWRNTSFRGYADYMGSDEFLAAVEELKSEASGVLQVLMCAEAVHWRCHRSLIADALFVRGVRVEHISSPRKRQPHRLTPFARVKGTEITYPVPEAVADAEASCCLPGSG